MKTDREELVFGLSVSAFMIPFVCAILSFLETGESYNVMRFACFLMAGSFIGSILGIISLLMHRSMKNKKLYILSLFPVFLFLFFLISDFIFSFNKP